MGWSEYLCMGMAVVATSHVPSVRDEDGRRLGEQAMLVWFLSLHVQVGSELRAHANAV